MRKIFCSRTNEKKKEITVYSTDFSRKATPIVVKTYELNDENKIKASELLKELDIKKYQ